MACARCVARALLACPRLQARTRALLNDPDANIARLEDFPRIDKPRICRRCNFRKLCFPRGEALEVRSTRRPATRAS